jgi:hypothetical protein
MTKRFADPAQLEADRLAKLTTLLEEWRDGKKSPAEVVHGTVDGMWGEQARVIEDYGWLRGKFAELILTDGENDYYINDEDGKLLYEDYDINKAIKPEVLTASANGGMSKEISALLAKADSGEMSADDIAFTIAEAILNEDSLCLDRIKAKIGQEKEEIEKASIHGSFLPETEDEIRTRLKDFLPERKIDQKKLCKHIDIDASGSGLIVPYPEDNEPISGNLPRMARVTTYSISFTPESPEKTQELLERVQQAVNRIADIPPKFESSEKHGEGSFGYGVDGSYKRPMLSNSYSNRGNLENTYVSEKDGKIVINSRLDLDDVYNLYYLLEDVIQPSEQIAGAMNKARYAEERGTILRAIYAPQAHEWETTPVADAAAEIGALDDVEKEKQVEHSIESAALLYAAGQIDDEEFLQQITILAERIASGKVADPYGALPSFQALLITDGSDGENSGKKQLSAYAAHVKKTANDILVLKFGHEFDDNKTLLELASFRTKYGSVARKMLEQMQERASDDCHWSSEEWRKNNEDRPQSLEEVWEKINKMLAETERAEKLSDAMAAKAAQDPELAKRALTVISHSNLDSYRTDIETCVDRTFQETEYTTRTKDSIAVRYELPKALKKFIHPDEQRPDMLALTKQDKPR